MPKTSSASKRRPAEPAQPIDPLTGNRNTIGRGKSARTKLPRAVPTSPPLTRPDAIEIWKRWSLSETIQETAAGFRVDRARIVEVLSGKRFPEAEELSLI